MAESSDNRPIFPPNRPIHRVSPHHHQGASGNRTIIIIIMSSTIFSNTATVSKPNALNADRQATAVFSALLFNSYGSEPILRTGSKQDYRESLLDGLYVFHNPHALRPLPFAYFKNDDITQAFLRPGDPIPKYICRHGHLIQRSSLVIRPKAS